MKPRENEVGVVLEPREIALIQNAYVDCRSVRPCPIGPETSVVNEPIAFSEQQADHIGRVVLVGAASISLNAPKTIGARLLHPIEFIRAKREVPRLKGFYLALHNTVEASKAQVSAQDPIAQSNV